MKEKSNIGPILFYFFGNRYFSESNGSMSNVSDPISGKNGYTAEANPSAVFYFYI